GGGKYLFLDHVSPCGDIGPFHPSHGVRWTVIEVAALCKTSQGRFRVPDSLTVTCEELVFKNFSMYFFRHQIVGIATRDWIMIAIKRTSKSFQ
ncbi:hypothetical protein AVEN_127043-1, partial [Araneus ventricosus]